MLWRRAIVHAACGLPLALVVASGCEEIANLGQFQPPRSAASGGAGAAGGSGATGGEAGSGATGGEAGSGATGGGGGAPPSCGVSSACVPDPPSGWTAIHLFPGPRPADCRTGTPGGLDVEAAASTCPTCSCAPAEGGTCGMVAFTFEYDSSSCGTSPSGSAMQSVASGACVSSMICCPSPTYANGVIIDAIQANGATCQSMTAGAADHPGPTFVDEQTACAIAGEQAGCEAGTTCVPNPPPGYVPRYCASSPTDVDPCPIEYPHERVVLYTDHVDTRTCSACGCAAPTGQVCPGTATRFSSSDCTTGGFVINYTPGTCYPITNAQSFQVVAGAPAGGACAETGGAVEGTVAPASPLKICCTQP